MDFSRIFIFFAIEFQNNTLATQEKCDMHAQWDWMGDVINFRCLPFEMGHFSYWTQMYFEWNSVKKVSIFCSPTGISHFKCHDIPIPKSICTGPIVDHSNNNNSIRGGSGSGSIKGRAINNTWLMFKANGEVMSLMSILLRRMADGIRYIICLHVWVGAY